MCLRVLDDGVGLSDEVRPGALGLHTMAHRARILEGTLAVDRRPTGGTSVVCRVPRAMCLDSSEHLPHVEEQGVR